MWEPKVGGWFVFGNVVSVQRRLCQKISKISCILSCSMASSTREVYDIKKFDGSNFALWKEQIQDVLVQKKQRLPILHGQREENMGLTQV